MNNEARRAMELSIVILALASSACEDLHSAPRFTSAHWTCVRRVEFGSLGHRRPVEFEVWMKGDSTLIGATVGEDTLRVLKIGKDAYGWREGQPNGLKYDSPSTDDRQLIVPSVDYVAKAAACRKNGKKGTTGTFGGHPFVRYDCEEKSDSTKRIYYYATDLQGFPVHATITYRDRTIVIYDAKSIEVPASFSDSLLQIPADVKFDPGPA